MIKAEDTGPTKRSHISSTLRMKGVANAVGLATAVPLKMVDVGTDWLRDCAATEVARRRMPAFAMTIIFFTTVARKMLNGNCTGMWKRA